MSVCYWNCSLYVLNALMPHCRENWLYFFIVNESTKNVHFHPSPIVKVGELWCNLLPIFKVAELFS